MPLTGENVSCVATQPLRCQPIPVAEPLAVFLAGQCSVGGFEDRLVLVVEHLDVDHSIEKSLAGLVQRVVEPLQLWRRGLNRLPGPVGRLDGVTRVVGLDELAGAPAHLDAFPDPSQLVFTAPEGGVLRYDHFMPRFFEPAVAASVGKPLVFHDLRHTHAAVLIAQGTHPKVLQARFGHSSIQVTLHIYGHLFPGLDDAAADALDDAIADRRVGLAWG